MENQVKQIKWILYGMLLALCLIAGASMAGCKSITQPKKSAMKTFIFFHTRGLEKPLYVTTNLPWQAIGTPIGFYLHTITKVCS